MQNLKFKVFYEPSGKIYDVLAMDFIKNTATIEYLPSKATVATAGKLKKGKTQVVGMDFCKIMQYTGINDHNGVEIYDGYIVKFDSTIPYPKDGRVPQDGDIGVIKFEEAEFIVRPIKSDVLFFRLDAMGDWVVIGNIYENKELLG